MRLFIANFRYLSLDYVFFVDFSNEREILETFCKYFGFTLSQGIFILAVISVSIKTDDLLDIFLAPFISQDVNAPLFWVAASGEQVLLGWFDDGCRKRPRLERLYRILPVAGSSVCCRNVKTLKEILKILNWKYKRLQEKCRRNGDVECKCDVWPSR